MISAVVLAELALAPATEVAAVQHHLRLAQPLVYPIAEPVRTLARAYVTAGVLPQRREADALHVAAATYFGIDYLVSWNHRHMTRPMKRLQYESVNQLNGYWKTPLICNPVEACDELRGG